ncbi:MAG TPA: hypothetical protein VMZ50_08825 [Phycisphaerae bacterium]|nr:hypothetical protein [Phycisphaerae bacterium]
MTASHRSRRDRHRGSAARWAAVLTGAAVIAATCTVPAAETKTRTEEPPERKQIESAVDGALKWLADKQIRVGTDKGYWDSPRYHTATASFVGLAFLANGHRPGRGPYGQVLDRAMRFVQESMDAEGYLGGKDNSMYVHAAATLFGLAYLGRSENPDKEVELAKWCRKSIDLIVKAQKVAKPPAERGGWRYTPYARDSDLSVTSWQLLVLHAARQCGYEIPDAVFQAAMRYVNRGFTVQEVKDDKGKVIDRLPGFVYRPGVSGDVEPAVTGVAVFLKALLEKEPDEKTAQSLEYLKKFTPGWGGAQYKGYFFFGTFYMVQGMFQVGGPTWEEFAPRIQTILLEHQEGDGHWELPADNVPQSHLAGRAYATALGVLILSIEKQYLPMYQRVKRIY